MSEQVGNQNVGFVTSRLIYVISTVNSYLLTILRCLAQGDQTSHTMTSETTLNPGSVKMCTNMSLIQIKTCLQGFLFSFSFLILFNVPSRLFHSYRDKSIGRWGETGAPRENHLTHPQAELGLSHMWPVRGSNLHQTQG